MNQASALYHFREKKKLCESHYKKMSHQQGMHSNNANKNIFFASVILFQINVDVAAAVTA